MTLTDRLWDQVEDALYITKEQWLASIEGWEITPHMQSGEVVGAVMVKGTELHFTNFGKLRVRREDIRHYLEPIIEKHGSVTTRTPHHMERQHRFNQMLGFVETGGDEFDIFYKLDAETFRRKICQ